MSKDKKSSYRITLVDDSTHRNLWTLRFTRGSFFTTVITISCVLLACGFLLVLFTPLKNLVPGYPGADAQRLSAQTAMKIDSLERVVSRWEFYSENIKRVILGEDPVKIDSLIKAGPKDSVSAERSEYLRKQDSILRKSVSDAEQFALGAGKVRNLPIEGMHFFTPLKGVVAQGFDAKVHPYLDITAPPGSVVMSALDGTVVFSAWTDETGYNIQVQHSNDILTIYKHNEKLLRSPGDKVTAGSPLALIGNADSQSAGSYLQFELWYKGEAVDPTHYIKF